MQRHRAYLTSAKLNQLPHSVASVLHKAASTGANVLSKTPSTVHRLLNLLRCLGYDSYFANLFNANNRAHLICNKHLKCFSHAPLITCMTAVSTIACTIHLALLKYHSNSTQISKHNSPFLFSLSAGFI